MLYRLEQRIHTLAQNVVGRATTHAPVFSAEDVTFSSWKVDKSDGWWTHKYWLATAEIDAKDYIGAWQTFWSRLARIVPRMSLVSQCYMEYLGQPILILRKDSDIAFVRWVKDTQGAGLMFMDDERKALDLLLNDAETPNEFFYYWYDATNSSGYASKLLLMFSAVEALVKIGTGMHKGKKDFAKLENILGPELKKDLWGTQEEHTNALRHRLIHGEYFQPEDGQKDYLLLLHQKIITSAVPTLIDQCSISH